MSKLDVQVTLTVIEGPDTGASFQISKQRSIMGRKSADLSLTDSKISVKHAAIDIDGAEVHITDLNSRNGIFINDKQTKKALLQNLDELKLGLTKLKIFIVEDLQNFQIRNAPAVQDPTPLETPRDIAHMIDDELKRFSKWDISQSADETVKSEDMMAARFLYGLQIIEGPNQGKTIRIEKNLSHIGRANTEVVLNDTDISRLHCSIEVTADGKVLLKDLGSTNGTYVNLKRVTDTYLKPEDQIRLGSTLLRFVGGKK